MSHSFLIVEDHPITRSGTVQMLRHAFPGCSCEEVATRAAARRALGSKAWSLVLLDIDLPDGCGLDLLPCGSPVLVLSMHSEGVRREEALGAGADRFVSKCESPHRILTTVRSMLGEDAGGASAEQTGRVELSGRERLVLRSLLDGRRLVEIASDAGLSPTTVQSYKNRLFEKLGVESVIELARLARDLDL